MRSAVLKSTAPDLLDRSSQSAARRLRVPSADARQGSRRQRLDATARELDVQRIAAAMRRDIKAYRVERGNNAAQAQAEQARSKRAAWRCSTRRLLRTTPRRRVCSTALKALVISASTRRPGPDRRAGPSRWPCSSRRRRHCLSSPWRRTPYAASRNGGTSIASGQRALGSSTHAHPADYKFVHGRRRNTSAGEPLSELDCSYLLPGLQADRTAAYIALTVTLSAKSRLNAYFCTG